MADNGDLTPSDVEELRQTIAQSIDSDPFAEKWEHEGAHAALRTLCDHVSRLTAALDRVPDDTDRLDWLEREVVRLEVVRLEFTEAGSEAGDYGSVLSSWPRGFWINDGDGRDHSTLREAIDAARARPASETPAETSDE